MTERGGGLPSDSYSPQRRTALVLTGTGTAGAYHAGVLRALHEAGVKIDIVAGRGIGIVGAIFSAIDGAQRLWDEGGFWRAKPVRHFYSWRPLLRLVFLSVVLSMALVLVPLAAVAAGLVVFPIDFIAKMIGGSAVGLADGYVGVVSRAFRSDGLPTWLPRLTLLVLAAAATIAAVAAWGERGERRARGPAWWRIFRPPLTAGEPIAHCWTTLWALIRGAAHVRQPPPVEIGRRFTEMLGENLGQPGFRELLLIAHDLDAHLDLVFALVGEGRRRNLLKRRSIQDAEARRAELLDLSGIDRDRLADAVAAAFTVPLATEPHTMHFSVDSYWQGESHRLFDRPGSLVRLVEELVCEDAEQIILVSAAPDSPGPHGLASRRLDARGRLGEYLQSTEAATVRDVVNMNRHGAVRIFTIRPGHNPVGVFDFGGGFDDRSDRPQPLTELLSRGYEDAYRQFIEPVVGGSGELMN